VGKTGGLAVSVKKAEEESSRLDRGGDHLLGFLKGNEPVIPQYFEQFDGLDSGTICNAEVIPELRRRSAGVALSNVELNGEGGSLKLRDDCRS
jgi:hypothetical protein